jgi:murein DD-endopeptidase MepM/ murein hydrolase activator NlpD
MAAALAHGGRAAALAGPPALALPDWSIPQGGSFFAIVSGESVTGASVSFAGRTAEAVADGGGLLAFLGAGQFVGDTAQPDAGSYPVQATVTLTDGGTRTLSGKVRIVDASFPVEAITLGPEESALLDPALTQRELATMNAFLAGSIPRRQWDGFFLRPAAGPLTDVYGSRRSYNGGPPVGSHSGTDIGADAGDPIRAAAAGRVIHAGPLPVRGNATYIDHGAGVFTGYCHQSRIDVQAGQDVAAGEHIGLVGATGLVTGPHLHWEVVVSGCNVNALLWTVDQK